MKSSDVDDDLTPGRDRDHSRLANFISNYEGGILDTVFWNSRHLGYHQRSLVVSLKSV